MERMRMERGIRMKASRKPGYESDGGLIINFRQQGIVFFTGFLKIIISLSYLSLFALIRPIHVVLLFVLLVFSVVDFISHYPRHP
jgi:hypothetical protein